MGCYLNKPRSLCVKKDKLLIKTLNKTELPADLI